MAYNLVLSTISVFIFCMERKSLIAANNSRMKVNLGFFQGENKNKVVKRRGQ